jgi:hypothetical protein
MYSYNDICFFSMTHPTSFVWLTVLDFFKGHTTDHTTRAPIGWEYRALLPSSKQAKPYQACSMHGDAFNSRQLAAAQ